MSDALTQALVRLASRVALCAGEPELGELRLLAGEIGVELELNAEDSERLLYAAESYASTRARPG